MTSRDFESWYRGSTYVELPICGVDSALSFELMDIAYKTADQLMVIELQNKLVDLHLNGMPQVLKIGDHENSRTRTHSLLPAYDQERGEVLPRSTSSR